MPSAARVGGDGPRVSRPGMPNALPISRGRRRCGRPTVTGKRPSAWAPTSGRPPAPPARLLCQVLAPAGLVVDLGWMVHRAAQNVSVARRVRECPRPPAGLC